MFKLAYLQTVDVSDPNAVATAVLVDIDDIDREAGSLVLHIQLKPAERQTLQDVIARAKLRAQRRINAARAARLADSTAPIDLQKPIAGEDAP